MQKLTISAVTQLTGIPAHTIRKWESRHGIATPERTPTGRREYSQSQVDTLRLIKQLSHQGHSLAHLADLDQTALQELAQQHRTGGEIPRPDPVRSVILVGETMGRHLTHSTAIHTRHTQNWRHWLADSLADAPDASWHQHVLVLDTLNLNNQDVEQLCDLSLRCGQLVLIYRHLSRPQLTELKNADVQCVQGPASDGVLLHALQLPNLAQQPAQITRDPLFSATELARIAAMSPTLACECPNHIARLLTEIHSFEEYSQQCLNDSQEDIALHTQLYELAGQARVLFEDALLNVAAADGITLKTNR